jgi:hypothetical protein
MMAADAHPERNGKAPRPFDAAPDPDDTIHGLAEAVHDRAEVVHDRDALHGELRHDRDNTLHDPKHVLLERARWYECALCRATFGTAEGLRGHHRFGRCPSRGDPVDNVNLIEDGLRDRVRRRLRALAGGSG